MKNKATDDYEKLTKNLKIMIESNKQKEDALNKRILELDMVEQNFNHKVLN